MYSYIINGGKRLNGEIDISGSKNASLPILAASILNKGIVKLYNVPEIEDINVTVKILEHLNCKIKRNKNKLVLDSSQMQLKMIPEELMRKLRSSVILVGSLISRFGKASFSYPGGCDIGSRPIDLHLNSFRKMGIKITENEGRIECSTEEIQSVQIHLDFPSVGATENIILASCLANGKIITIGNAAREPEIVDLCNFLIKMGVSISGAGTSFIKIIGTEKLKDISYNIMPDRIEAGTSLVAGCMTRGNVRLNKVNPEHLKPVLYKLEEAGCIVVTDKNSVTLKMTKRPNKLEIKTLPYPGFPTDMQAIFGSLLMIAKGTSTITENIFENRFKYAGELSRLGARFKQEGNLLIIEGKRRLSGTVVKSTDLRGGAALILAGLCAKGQTQVDDAEYVLRGYDKIDQKLRQFGADIQLQKN